MKNVSSNFRNELNNGNRNYVKSADITLKNGTVLHIDNSKLWNNGLKIENAVSNTDSFDISSVIIGQLTLTLLNINDEFSEYDFTDCVASNVKVGLKLEDGTTESLSYGKFYLNETNYSSEVITLTFYDCLYKFDKSYSESKLQYPATLNKIVRDACDVCGVTMGTVTFDNDDYIVQERPSDESLTFRQVLLWVGQISVHYFYADEEGRLAIGWYHVDESNIDHSYIEETVLQDVSGDEVLDTSGGEIITNIETGLSRFTSLNTQLDDVVITGIRVLHEIEGENGQETITYQSGNDGYILSVSGNKMIQGDEGSKVASMIAAKVVGVRFRAFTASCLSDPTIECGDSIILADRKGTRYRSIVTNNTFQPGTFQNISCGAKSPARNSAERYSQLTQVYTDYRKELEKERTDREEALDELKERVDSSSGVFTTVETQPDGSNKYYLHDKPTLEESDIIWTMTAEAWSVSTDGGTTVNAGMTVDGDTIVRILTAVGVNADWIKTGAFRIEKNGEVMFSADTETGIIDIVANSFTLKGQSIEDIAENQVNDFVDAVYTPAIDNIQKQIDGQIETYYYDYEPTLENVPAIDWTSEEERRSHEGDLFYWKSRGYAYRFFKDGDTWKWQMVQDTDITKALEQASEAKDTADQKRRVFVVTPNPPYDVGDLWVGNNTSDLMRCQRARSSGSYNADDWIKAVKYTDDTELNNFIREDYSETIQEIYNSVDKKAQTWYQTTDPSLDWASIEESVLQDTDGNSILDSESNDIITLWEKEKSTHDGDLWRNPANNTEYMYVDGNWVEMSIPDEVFDTIDGKAQIFVTQPVPPYDVGDTWFTGTTILVCDTRRDSGEFVAEDWSKQDNYTDDSALYEFMEGDYKQTIEELQTQADSKAETWYQPTDPSDLWSSEEKLRHDGDIWYNTTSQKTYIYNGSSWEETKSTPPDEVFDTIDGKAQIFVRQPVPPYAVGDLWFDSASSDIMTCIYSRESGNFNAGDWQKRNKYTDDSALQNFLSGEYSETITELKTQADKKAETWYQGTDPSTSWNATQKAEHEGDLWYNTSNQKTYIYDGSAWQETKSTPPDEVFDEIDGKAQIFVRQPVPPYSVGDLWFNSATSDIMTCITARPSGNYNAKDWEKRNKYTDDSYAQEVNDELNQFIENYNDEIQEIANSIDKKSETWYQTSDPANQWTDNVENDPLLDTNGNNITDTTGENITTVWEKEKTLHDGDLWHNPNTNKEYIYVDGEWKETSIPDDVFDIIDGKAQIFVSTPTPPYAIGDLWFNSATSDIMTCINGRESGSYASSDWQKRNKYTDDSYAEEVAGDLSNFADQVVGDLENMQTQIDGKIETYYYDYQPTLTNIPASAWTTETERQKHVGDLFYYKSTGFTYRFLKDGSTWKWQAIKDSDIDEALQQAATAQDTADGKRRVFTSTPTPPYDVGDLWAQGSNGDIMRCKTARSSGAYVSTDWEKASKYTDDTAVDDLDEKLNSTEEIFNRLTQDGKVKGIYLKNGQLYINASYLASGAINIRDSDGNETLYANVDTGVVRIKATSFSLTDGRSIEDIASDEINDFVTSIYTPKINSLQSQIDGQIETYYYDYEPTLTNVPASAWTTETERQSHEGDIFYWKSKGYAYRFYKDGSTWKWQLVQDTDITKALQQAADAQDTADQKRRVFVRQPTPPYDVGDLWVGNNTSDLMRCQRSRSSGSYNADDWIKAVKYTDDTELNNFIREDYSETIQEIYNSVDKKSETWYQTSDPANQWTDNVDNDPLLDTNGNNITDTTGENITTVWEKEKTLHDGDLWHNPNTNKEYIYVDGEWKETSIPDDVFDIIDGKAQIFVSTPTPPYAIGDLWFNSATSDIMTCINGRENGSYASSDWQKRNKYTDDSALQNFLSGEYSETITELKTQADKKAETWYQGTDPSTSWNATQKAEHEGDLWYNTSNQKTYIYDGSAWQETKSTPPDEVFDEIDGKAQIFVRQPVPPYSVGDLWFNSATSDIMTCITARPSGNYNAKDWEKRNKYTDDSYAQEVAKELLDFSDAVTEDISNLQTQIDGKIETWYYNYQPTLSNVPASQWTTTSERQKHVGDLFYWQSQGYTYRFQQSGSSFAWQKIQDSDISDAMEEASKAQDTADSKRRVFITTPIPPYDVGDLWAQGGSGDIMRCIRSRSSGNYTSSDWDKASKYTDDSAVGDLDDSLDQQGIFNRLTNNGQSQGIYLQNNRIYINATYIQSGTLSANLIKGGILTLGGASNGNGRLEVLNPSNQVIGTINNTGVNFTGVFQNRLGQEFIEMDESILKGGYGSTVHGRIDLSAQYSDGSYRTVVEALSGSLTLKSINGAVEIVRTDGAKDISIGYAVGSIDGNVSTRIKTMYITQTVSDYYVGFVNTQNTVRFSVLTTSDAKLKKNIKDTKVTALDYINQIQHKSFDLKEGGGHKDCGYIAQDLQKIYPGFVVEAPEYNNDGEKTGGTLQVNTFAMLPYMTKAIQELSEENRKLKEEIKEIKKMIKSIGGQ